MPGSDKDLEKIIAGIGMEEQAAAQKQAQIDRLKQLIEKQKNELAEKTKIIKELESKVKNMYDLPADVEELKRLIGEQRAELNNKDQQLEMAYAQGAQHEAELKNTKIQSEAVSKSMQENYTQITQLKTNIAERDARITILDKEAQDAKANLEQSRKFQEELRKEVNSLKDVLRENEFSSEQYRNKIESEIKEKLFASKGELSKQINEMDKKILELELENKEYKHKAESASRDANEIKAKAEEMIAKFDQIQEERLKLQDEIKQLTKSSQELQEFKTKNENVVKNLQGLTKLFEHEPLFKIFNIVRKVGIISPDDLKGALGIPSITVNKYIQLFVNAELFQVVDNGKISLKNKLPE